MNFATMETQTNSNKAQAYLERQKDKPYWPFVNFYKFSVYAIFIFYFIFKIFIYLAALGIGYGTWFVVGQNLGFLCLLKLNKKYGDRVWRKSKGGFNSQPVERGT